MTSLLAIVNPAAGGGRCGKLAPAALKELEATGAKVEVAYTKAAGEATQIARKAYAEGVCDFIAVGGDGTSFEIVNGLFPEALNAAHKPTLGFLPLGTGNSFLRDFTTDGASYALDAIKRGQLRPCDVIRLRHRGGELYYINILSFGFLADVCSLTNRRFKRFGEAGYGMGVAVKLIELPSRPIPHSLDGGPLDRRELAFIVISNSRYTGGKMLISPGAEVANGFAEVTVAEKLDRISFVKTFPKIFDGSHLGHPALSSGRARKIEFKVDRMEDAMIDGEVIPVWPTELEVIAGALEVRA
ncbi:MAG TPA: diacylglycerol kinase family protein [Polyangiales bacterium]|nr:diacylglycerol kinase family protein [Polyangiales bacterium]